MSLCSISGFLLAAVAVGLVSADSGTVVKVKDVKVKVNPNDYWDSMDISWKDTKKSSKITGTMPTKKELPDTMMFKMTAVMNGGDPMEFETTICDALNDDTIGKSFVEAGLRHGDFPEECPFRAGDFVISEWDPPAEKIPPGSDGPVTGQIFLMEEGKDPYITIDYEIDVSHPPPDMGR